MKNQNLHIDYLNFTFKHKSDLNPFQVLARAQATVATFSMGLEIGDIEDKGLHGYSWSFRITVAATGELAGFVAAGGTNHGTVFFNFSGKGCKQIDVSKIHSLLQRVNQGRITRLDIAYDDLEGKRTPFDVRDDYRAGLFKNRGQMPKHDMRGPWESPEHWGDGLTFYVGKRDTGKMLRAYHKGRQLGDPHSPWVRFEVELSRKKRDIPLDCLLNLLDTFIGAYSWLAWAAEEIGAPIGMIQKETQKISVNHLIAHAKRSYGKLIGTLSRIGIENDQLFQILTKQGTPQRLDVRYLYSQFVTDSHRREHDDLAIVSNHGELLNYSY